MCRQMYIQKSDNIKTKMVLSIVALIVMITVVATLYITFQAVRNSSKKKHRTSLANFQLEVFDGVVAFGSVLPKNIEDRMRESLPQLEALVRSAPSSDDGLTGRVLDSWRTQLSLGDSSLSKPSDAWGRLFLAQRFVALGDADNATAAIVTLRKSANPSEAWATTFWSTLIDIDQLQGDRNKAWKDLAEYKLRFKQKASPELEHIIASI